MPSSENMSQAAATPRAPSTRMRRPTERAQYVEQPEKNWPPQRSAKRRAERAAAGTLQTAASIAQSRQNEPELSMTSTNVLGNSRSRTSQHVNLEAHISTMPRNVSATPKRVQAPLSGRRLSPQATARLAAMRNPYISPRVMSHLPPLSPHHHGEQAISAEGDDVRKFKLRQREEEDIFTTDEEDCLPPRQRQRIRPPTYDAPEAFDESEGTEKDGSDAMSACDIQERHDEPVSLPPKAQKITERSGRPKAADYETPAQEVLAAAIVHYVAYLSTVNAYPDKMEELVAAKNAWSTACDDTGIELRPTNELVKLARLAITQYSTHFRSELKTTARGYVETVFGFQTTGKITVKKRNRALAEKLLKNDAFVYRKLGDMDNHHKGLYQHRIIQLIINKVWFKDKRDDGVILDKVYRPFPFVAFAIVLTAIECAIDEWVSGTREYVTFAIEAYKHRFEHHLSAIKDYNTTSGDLEIMKKICQRVSDDGRINAKAIPIEMEATRTLAPNAIKNAIEEFRRKDGSLTDSDDSDNEGGNGSYNGQPEVEDGFDH